MLSFEDKSKNSKRIRPHIWVNNRQRAIDPDKYCSLCQYEYSKRSNFLMHVRNIHKGQFPPKINEQDQSLHEMNEENLHEQFHEENNETSNDRSGNSSLLIFKQGEKFNLVVSTDNNIQPLQTVNNQLNIAEGKLRPRTNPKSTRELPIHAKVKCDICNKFYRDDYMKVSLKDDEEQS